MAIWDIEAKFLKGQSLADEEIRVAVDFLKSPNKHEALVAAEGLLRQDDIAEEQALAKSFVRGICKDILAGYSPLYSNLPLVLVLIPRSELLGDSTYTQTIYRAAASSESGCRMNSMILLRELVKSGDQTASRILVDSLNDSDDRVRTNADFFLAELKNEGYSI